MRTSKNAREAAFTRADLLTVLGVLALAGLLGLPLLAQPQRHSRTALCFDNLRALMRASHAYAADHDDTLPANPTSGFGNTNAWSGPDWLELPPDNNSVTPAASVMRGSLWPYMDGNAAAFRCPEDFTGRILASGVFQPRVRSYSMNSFMGNAEGWLGGPGRWIAFLKLSDLTQPAGLWTLIEERPDSINDGFFAVDMSGFPDRPSSFRMVDFPSFYHARGSTVAFGDGHAEHRVWRDARTVPRWGGSLISLNVPQPNNPDLAWLLARSSVPK